MRLTKPIESTDVTLNTAAESRIGVLKVESNTTRIDRHGRMLDFTATSRKTAQRSDNFVVKSVKNMVNEAAWWFVS